MDSRLESHLRGLQADLERARPSSPENSELIERLMADVEAILAAGKGSQVRVHGLRERLIGAATAFEAAYPDLSKAIENVIEVLVQQNL